MTILSWTVGAILVIAFAALAAARRPSSSGIPLFLGALGLGLCFLLLGGLRLASPPLPHPILTRLLWSTVL